MSKIIVVTGIPASGKSSLANYLSNNFNLRLFSKDDYKLIEYINNQGFDNFEERNSLTSIATTKMFEDIKKEISKNNNVIIDIVFDNEFKTFLESFSNQLSMIIYLKTNLLLSIRRYNKRVKCDAISCQEIWHHDIDKSLLNQYVMTYSAQVNNNNRLIKNYGNHYNLCTDLNNWKHIYEKACKRVNNFLK